MPSKTQIRLQQLTGTLDDTVSLAAIPNESSLQGVMDHLASSVQRIHGNTGFAASKAGQFNHSTIGITGSIMQANAAYTLKTRTQALTIDGKTGLNLQEDGSTVFSISDSRAVDLQATAAVTIDSSGGTIGIGSDADNNNMSIGTAGTRTIGLGSATATLNIVGSAADITLDAGSNDIAVTAAQIDATAQNAFGILLADSQANAFSFDADGGQADLLKVDTSADKVVIHALDITNALNALGDLTVTGNLTVEGDTTTLNTATLTVEDKFILLGDGNQALNSPSGMIFASGSDVSARPDAAFGKLHGDTNGVFVFGSVASASASINNLSGLTADLPLRAGVFQVGTAGTELLDVNGSQLRLQSGAGHEFDLGSASDLIDFGHGGTGKGQIKFDSNKFVVSASIDQLDLMSATGGVNLMDTHDGSNPRTIFSAKYNVNANGGEILFDSSRAGAVNTAGGQPLQLGHYAGGFLETGVLDGGAKQGFSTLQVSGSYNDAGNGEYTTTLVVGGAQGSFGSDVIKASKANLIISGSNLKLDHGVSGSATLQFKSDTANVVSLAAPASLAGNVALTLPPNDGNAGDVLQTDGSGVLTFVAAGGSANSIKRFGTLASLVTVNTPVDFNVGGTFTESTAALNVSAVSAGDRINNVDVYVNGQLLMSGTSAPGSNVAGGDYVLVDNAGSGAGSEGEATLKFAFQLEAEDVVSVIVRA